MISSEKCLNLDIIVKESLLACPLDISLKRVFNSDNPQRMRVGRKCHKLHQFTDLV